MVDEADEIGLHNTITEQMKLGKGAPCLVIERCGLGPIFGEVISSKPLE